MAIRRAQVLIAVFFAVFAVQMEQACLAFASCPVQKNATWRLPTTGAARAAEIQKRHFARQSLTQEASHLNRSMLKIEHASSPYLLVLARLSVATPVAPKSPVLIGSTRPPQA
jgi:hypothetical protein